MHLRAKRKMDSITPLHHQRTKLDESSLKNKYSHTLPWRVRTTLTSMYPFIKRKLYDRNIPERYIWLWFAAW